MKISKYKYIISAGLILLLIGTAMILYPVGNIGAEDESTGRIAYVDVWAVFNVHPRKAEAEEELNKLAQSMQSELEKKAKDLPKEQQQDMLKEYQTKLSQQEQDLIQNIIDSIKDVVIEVAKDKEVKMVIDKKNVIYGGYDLTQDVIDHINNNKDKLQPENDSSNKSE